MSSAYRLSLFILHIIIAYVTAESAESTQNNSDTLTINGFNSPPNTTNIVGRNNSDNSSLFRLRPLIVNGSDDEYHNQEPEDWHPQEAINQSTPTTTNSAISTEQAIQNVTNIINATEAINSTVPPIQQTQINQQYQETQQNATTEKVTESEENEESEEIEWNEVKEINWNLSYESTARMDGFNEAITHYQVQFKSFKCIDIECQCKEINLNIETGSIRRVLNNLSCKKVFDVFKFSVLPGITYQFQITPNVYFIDIDSDKYSKIITKSKTFTIIIKEIDVEMASFELLLALDHAVYNSLNMDINELSIKLIEEVSELTEINKMHISIAIEPPSGDLGIARISIILMRIIDSTKPQIAIEMIRNLYYERDQSLLSRIIQSSSLMQVAAVKLKRDLIEENTFIPLTSNYGAIFLCMIVMAIFCFLISRCLPDKFSIIIDFCKVLCSVLLIQLKRFIDYASNSSFLSNYTNNRWRRRTPQYDVLNISEDLDATEIVGDESGIVIIKQVFEEKHIPSFTRERYIKVLRENWLTSIERLKQLHEQDWNRLGIPQNVYQPIISKMYGNTQSDGYNSSNISNELSYPISTPNNNDPTIDTTNDGTNMSETSFSDF